MIKNNNIASSLQRLEGDTGDIGDAGDAKGDIKGDILSLYKGQQQSEQNLHQQCLDYTY